MGYTSRDWKPACRRRGSFDDVAPDKPGFFEEMKRRHVWRVAAAYAIAGWLVVQIATQVFPIFHMPDWTAQIVVLLVVLGFPFAVGFAWIYELTPTGLRRTAPADSADARSEHAHRSMGQKLNTIITVVLVLAVAVTGWRLYTVKHQKAGAPAAAAQVHGTTGMQHNPVKAIPTSAVAAAKAPSAAASTPIAAAPIPARSIAVLPFENLNVDQKDAYFVAGMQDLILTKLADIGDLKVISRTSTEKYKSHPEDLKAIGRQLGVATILEGSVQKAGNQVLINVQLIDCKTDSHIWAQSYQRTLDNVFGVEGDVAQQIATSLNARLTPSQSKDLAVVPTRNQAAMDTFLRAEYQANKSNTNYYAGDYSGWRAAIPLYRQAIAKDPGFALAYARLSYVESHLAYISGEGVAALDQQARTDAEAAQKLAPHAVATLLAFGYCDYYGEGDFAAALKTFKAALILRPNDSATLAAIGYVERKQNNYDAALASLQRAFTLDPRNSALAFEIGATYMMVSRYPETENWLRRALALDPHNLGAKAEYPYAILLGRGDVARSLAAAGGDAPAMRSIRVSLLIYQRKYRDALALLDAIPDTPDDFTLVTGQSKALQQADLYRMMGEAAKARPLYQQALGSLRAQLAKSEQEHSGYLSEVRSSLADAELGLGQTRTALTVIASAQAANVKLGARHPGVLASATEINASLYAQAHRPDLAVPLLARALTLPAIGWNYSPVMLWLDPVWDPIRHDPRFQALLKKYAQYKPAVTYPVPSRS